VKIAARSNVTKILIISLVHRNINIWSVLSQYLSGLRIGRQTKSPRNGKLFSRTRACFRFSSHRNLTNNNWMAWMNKWKRGLKREKERESQLQRQTKLPAKSTSWTPVTMVTVDNALVARPPTRRLPCMVIWRVLRWNDCDGRHEPATDYANERLY